MQETDRQRGRRLLFCFFALLPYRACLQTCVNHKHAHTRLTIICHQMTSLDNWANKRNWSKGLAANKGSINYTVGQKVSIKRSKITKVSVIAVYSKCFAHEMFEQCHHHHHHHHHRSLQRLTIADDVDFFVVVWVPKKLPYPRAIVCCPRGLKKITINFHLKGTWKI